MPKDDLKATIQRIHQVGASTLGACGDVNRNVMCCPAPYKLDPVHQKMQRQADELAAYFAPKTSAYHDIFLKDLDSGWTLDDRRAYFNWFRQAAAHRGGMSFGGFLENIKEEALTTLTEDETKQLEDVLTAAPPPPVDPLAALQAREVVKKWSVDELLSVVDDKLVHRDFDRGRAIFAEAVCFRCHRVRGEGGSVGPDLTSVGGRFNNRNLLESMIEPNKVISDQYEKTTFLLDDGRVVEGRVINLSGNSLNVLTDMFDPSKLESVDREHIDESRPSTVSMMPDSLLDRFTEEEILDLMAFLKSGGNAEHSLFLGDAKSE